MQSFVFFLLVLPGAALRLVDNRKRGPVGYFCDKSDGFGAQLQCKFEAYALARHDNKCYHHSQFDQNNMHDSNFDADGLVNLQSDANCNGNNEGMGLKNMIGSNRHRLMADVDAYLTPKVLGELRAMYDAGPSKPKVEDCKVVFHVRRGDVTNHGIHKNGAKSLDRLTDNNRIYDAITSKFNGKNVCIFSEGAPEDFGEIADLSYVKFHLNGPADHPFHNMVMAPELVIAKSSFSYSAALLNQGKVYYLEEFWHPALENWQQISHVHLLSFRSCSQDEQAPCNEKFFEELNLASQKAAHLKIIDRQHLFRTLPDEIYKDPKWQDHVQDGVRGRGYWFWKAALFNNLVRNGTIFDGDVVVWADPDSALFLEMDEEKWKEQLKMFKNGELDIFVERQPKAHIRHVQLGDGRMLTGSHDLCEYSWTKQDIFEKFGTTWDDQQYGLTSQAHGSFYIIAVNERTRKLMKMHEELMADFHLCSDEPSTSPNNPHFLENRHDQSLFSMMIKAQVPTIADGGASAPCLAQKGMKSFNLADWKKHPTYGVPGLHAHIGHFPEMTHEIKKAHNKAPTDFAGFQKVVKDWSSFVN